MSLWYEQSGRGTRDTICRKVMKEDYRGILERDKRSIKKDLEEYTKPEHLIEAVNKAESDRNKRIKPLVIGVISEAILAIGVLPHAIKNFDLKEPDLLGFISGIAIIIIATIGYLIIKDIYELIALSKFLNSVKKYKKEEAEKREETGNSYKKI